MEPCRPTPSLHDTSAMIQLLFLLTMVLGVVRAAPEDCDRFQSFLANGTTTVNQLTPDGKVAPLTVINMTPIFAPCGTDWTIMRETLTVIATDCDEIRTRDEPLLTSMGGSPKTTQSCFVTVSYRVITQLVWNIPNLRIDCSPPSLYHPSPNPP